MIQMNNWTEFKTPFLLFNSIYVNLVCLEKETKLITNNSVQTISHEENYSQIGIGFGLRLDLGLGLKGNFLRGQLH